MSPKPSLFNKLVVPVCLVLIVLLFEACKDKIKTDLIGYKAMDESLTNSSRFVERQTEAVIASMNDKLTDPATYGKAAIWYPKAQYILNLSNIMVGYIDELKSSLKKEAGLKNDNGSMGSYREADKNAVMRLFIKNKEGVELDKKLNEYRRQVLAADREIDSMFANQLPVTTMVFESSAGKEQDFTKTFFDDIPAVAALAILSTFENNIRIAEFKTISFCHNHITKPHIEWWPTPFAFQSITHPEPGELVEITAGIGSVTPSFKTEVSVDGQSVQVDSYGTANYKFHASAQPGKHIVAVALKYIDQDANMKVVTKEIEYTVVAKK